MKTSLFSTFSGLLLLAAVLAGCSSKSPGNYQGYIEGEYVYVASPLGGALLNLAVARGDTVKAGQLLFELERQSEAAALDQAEKNVNEAKANLDLAQSTYLRRKELRESPSAVVSAEELDKAHSDRDAAQAQYDSQSAALDKARWSFDQKQQSSPTNALVQDTLYRQGEWVAAGNPVVSLLPPGNIKVRFFVAQADLPRIKIGSTANVTFDGGTKAYTATINYISTQNEYTPPVIFSRETRANLVYMIEAKFSPADAADLRPGQPVDVKLLQ
jgi:HlyD family secretion protein